MKVGVYVDNANISRSGGNGMRYDVLREFACRDGAEAVRLNVYVPFDEERASGDASFRHRAWSYHAALRDFGFKVVTKPVKWYTDDDGSRTGKANTDLDMAVDVLLQSDKLDRVVLCTGDGDFVQVVKAIQNKGCRVEIVAFNNVSGELRREVDDFVSGFLVPGLLPLNGAKDEAWAAMNGRARGVCSFHRSDKPYGFIRVMRRISRDLWVTDSRDEGSPYLDLYFYDRDLPVGMVSASELPSRNIIFEFDIRPSKQRGREGEPTAQNLQMVSRLQ